MVQSSYLPGEHDTHIRRKIAVGFTAVLCLLCLVCLGVLLGQPSWKRAIQVAYWKECLDDNAIDAVAEATIDE
ncbi:hypothetical protein ABTH94_20275, partial [Acinetobacter baumannii]